MPTFETPEAIVAVIDIGAGHIRIHASDRTDTVVELRPTDASEDADVRAAEETRVEYDSGRLVVRLAKNKIRSLFGRPGLVDLTVELPSDSRLEVKAWADFRSEGRIGESTIETASGSIRLDEAGRLKLRTAAGDISVGRSSGSVEATTPAGKIWIGEIDGAAVAKTSNGDITVGEVTGDARLNTANGDITIDRAFAAVGAKTAFGSVRIGEVVRGSVVLESGFGELEVGIREGTAAWLDVSSQYGTVRSDLGAIESPEKAEETVEVRARTRSGDIVIRRS